MKKTVTVSKGISMAWIFSVVAFFFTTGVMYGQIKQANNELKEEKRS